LKILSSIGMLFFTTLFLLQSGYGLLLHLRQEAVRSEVKQKYLEGFVGDDLIFLEIPVQLEIEKNNLFRRIHSKEFVYLGQMYDIVEQERIGNVTWYLVYPDKKETTLKKQMKRLMEDYDRQNGKRATDMLMLQLTLFAQNDSAENHFSLSDNPHLWYDIYTFSIKEWIAPTGKHPPCSVKFSFIST
jgi:hypothetical protein